MKTIHWDNREIPVEEFAQMLDIELEGGDKKSPPDYGKVV